MKNKPISELTFLDIIHQCQLLFNYLIQVWFYDICQEKVLLKTGGCTINIFLDECGFTGEDLLNSDQPIFTIASHNINEEKCKKLAKKFFDKIKASELKHVKMSKRNSQQNMISIFLEHLIKKEYNVKVSVVHKKYALVCKMVDMIETSLIDDGIDIYDKGDNIALANVLFYCLPSFGGETFFNDLLNRFQKLMRNKDRDSYDHFFELVFKEYDNKELEYLLTFLRSIPIKFGYQYLEFIKSDLQLDISLTSSLILMGRWRYDISDDITVIHDRSTNMSKQKNLWDYLVDPNLPSKEVGYDRRRMEFPIAIDKTKFDPSKNWVGLQFADLIAGATNYFFGILINKKKTKDKYAENLEKTIVEFIEHQIWPETFSTPKELGTQGENADDPIEFVRKIFHNNDL